MDNQKHVLVIDDDTGLCSVLVDKLSGEGFSVSSAHDGEEGLAKALDEHPDVILLDVMMPKLDGWGVLEGLRKDEWGSGVKVIMLTNLSDMESISQGVTQGTYEYLVKTDWDLDGVVSKVRAALGA